MASSMPFTASVALDTQCTDYAATSALNGVPDYPDILLTPSAIQSFLDRELSTTALDALYPYLWTVAARESSRIDALHVQLIKGRRIIVAENPQLHLVWTTGNVYIKPLPAFLLNHAFWRTHLLPLPRRVSHAELIRTPKKKKKPKVEATTIAHTGKEAESQVSSEQPQQQDQNEYFSAQAIGFVRTYIHLLRSPSDLRIAHQHGLVPEGISWTTWSHFAAEFAHNTDDPALLRWRFRYGQLRLRRLDWAVTLFGRGLNGSHWWYYRAYATIDMWLKDVFGVLALAYAFASILLAAMQVVLQAGTLADGGKIAIFESITAANVLGSFGLALIIGTMLSLFFIWSVSFILFARQFAWGFGHR